MRYKSKVNLSLYKNKQKSKGFGYLLILLRVLWKISLLKGGEVCHYQHQKDNNSFGQFSE